MEKAGEEGVKLILCRKDFKASLLAGTWRERVTRQREQPPETGNGKETVSPRAQNHKFLLF